MDARQEQLRNAILEEALDLPPDKRRMYIARACGGDEQIHQELIRLLGVHACMDSQFLESSPAATDNEPLAAGSMLDEYRVESVIGRGANIVYRAHDTISDRPVALKLISASGSEVADLHGRFAAEVKAMRTVQHENVVAVYDSGEYSGQPYLVMELLDGEDLASAIQGERTGNVSTRLRIARQIASALRRVHDAGILHRDIKSSNVFLERGGTVKLLDFGVSRLLEPGMTHASTFAGTLQYMAPEQLSGRPATRATDVYSYGVLLYELFCGAAARSNVGAPHLGKHPSVQPLKDIGAPAALSDLILASTSADPAARPRGFGAIEAELEAIGVRLNSAARPLRPTRRTAVVGAAACVACIALFFAGRALVSRGGDIRMDQNATPPAEIHRATSARDDMLAFREFERLVHSGTPTELRDFAERTANRDLAEKARVRAFELDSGTQDRRPDR